MNRTLRNVTFRTWALLATYAALFVVSRIPFYAEYFVFASQGDFGSYAWEAEQILSRRWPNFSIRPPLYPIFLAFSAYVGMSAYAILMVQSATSLLAGLFMLVLAPQQYRLASVIALFGAQFGEQYLLFETQLSPDIFFANLLIVLFGCLMHFTSRPSWKIATACSLMCGIALWARPTGIYLLILLIIVALLSCAMFKQSPLARIKTGAGFVLPMALMMLSLTLYNYINVNRFAFSVWGELNLAAATMYLWNEKSEYPESLNKDIKRIGSMIDPRELRTIELSSKPTDLYPALFSVFTTYYKAQRLLPNTITGTDGYSLNSYLDERSTLKFVAFNAIRDAPLMYMKFFYTNFYYYFSNYLKTTTVAVPALKLTTEGRFYGTHLVSRKAVMLRIHDRVIAGKPQTFLRDIGRNAIDSGQLSQKVVVTDRSHPPRGFVERGWTLGIADFIDAVHQKSFRIIAWLVAFVIVTLTSMLAFFRTKSIDIVLAALWLTVIGSAALTSLVEMGIARYSFVTLPQFYMFTVIGIQSLIQLSFQRTKITSD